MNFPIEAMVFVAYLDSLFSEGGAREVTPLRAMPETLNRLHAGAMREHARRSALLAREDAQWMATPDWRLDRQIIRLGLYLRERLDVAPGQRVALLSELRPEWLIADLAALGLGAVSVAIDPRLQRGDLAAALEDAAPSITFVSSAAQHVLESLDGRGPSHGQVITLDSEPAGDGVMRLQALLEMGGTLDTPERAQSYRADARSLAPDRPALRHYLRAPGGGWERVQLTQGEVIERLGAGWLREPARSGDVAYVCDPTISPAARLALYAFLGDGYTTTALAPVDWELSDLAALRPTKIVAPAALLAEAVRAGLARTEEPPGSDGGWVRHAARLVPLARERKDRRAIRDTLGGRARGIGSTDRLDAAVAERLGSIADVWPLPN
jgi:long-chain acyl-CoA synthetase